MCLWGINEILTCLDLQVGQLTYSKIHAETNSFYLHLQTSALEKGDTKEGARYDTGHTLS